MPQDRVNSPVKYLVILAILIIAIVIRSNWHRIRPPDNPLTAFSSGLTKDQITAFSVTKSGSELSFTKESEIWKLSGKPADTTLVGSLLTIITEPDNAQIVATSKDRLAEFELTDEAAYKVTINGKSLFLGKTGTGGIYARLESGDDTILLSGTPPRLMPEAEEWLDSRIYSFDSDTLTKIRIVSGGKTNGYLKNADKWINETTGQEVSKETIDKIIPSVNTIYGNKALLTESKPDGYAGSAELTVTVEAGEGKSETVEFFKGTDKYLGKRASDSAFFEVAEYSVTGIRDAVN